MDQRRFNELTDALLDQAEEVMDRKSKDYANGPDVLRNFRTREKELGIPMRQVWGVFFAKHADALLRWAKDGYVDGEPLRERLVDTINYCLFALAIEEDTGDTDSAEQHLAPSGTQWEEWLKDHPRTEIVWRSTNLGDHFNVPKHPKSRWSQMHPSLSDYFYGRE